MRGVVDIVVAQIVHGGELDEEVFERLGFDHGADELLFVFTGAAGAGETRGLRKGGARLEGRPVAGEHDGVDAVGGGLAEDGLREIADGIVVAHEREARGGGAFADAERGVGGGEAIDDR